MNPVQIPLLNDKRVWEMDILAIQEPARHLNARDTHNNSNSKFHLVNLPDPESRTCIYINKKIDINSWQVTARERDFCSITITVHTTTNESQCIHLHNVYNPSPLSTTSTDSPSTIPRLRAALATEGTHIMLGDFNLHHPYWGGQRCFSRHAMADQLIQLVTDSRLDLLLPPGTITRQMNAQQTTIDLVFADEWITERLLKCGVREDLHHDSDHLPIVTEISLHTTAANPAPCRAWKRMDPEKLLSAIEKNFQHLHSDTQQLTSSEEIEMYAQQMQDMIQQAIQEAVPWAKPSARAAGFWTSECKDAVTQARVLRHTWKQHPSQQSWN